MLLSKIISTGISIMPKIYHENGIIYINYEGDNFTVSNYKEFLKVLNKIKNISYDIDEQCFFERKMIAIDLLHYARQEFIKYQEKQCIKN
jgi:hypothetical protein